MNSAKTKREREKTDEEVERREIRQKPEFKALKTYAEKAEKRERKQIKIDSRGRAVRPMGDGGESEKSTKKRGKANQRK